MPALEELLETPVTENNGDDIPPSTETGQQANCTPDRCRAAKPPELDSFQARIGIRCSLLETNKRSAAICGRGPPSDEVQRLSRPPSKARGEAAAAGGGQLVVRIGGGGTQGLNCGGGILAETGNVAAGGMLTMANAGGAGTLTLTGGGGTLVFTGGGGTLTLTFHTEGRFTSPTGGRNCARGAGGRKPPNR